MKERSVDDIFQQLYETKHRFGVRRISQFVDNILGHSEYDRFWKDILDNNPGRKKHMWDDWQEL